MEIRELASGELIQDEGAFRMTPMRYHADPCAEPSLSNSVAQLLIDSSPLHAWTAHPRLNPKHVRKTAAKLLDFGSACHRLVLGEGAEIVEVRADAFRTKEAKAARDEAYLLDQIPLLSKDLDRARALAEAAHFQLGNTLDGFSAEVVVAAHGPGGWERIMLDGLSPNGLTLVDYKTTEAGAGASASAFAKTAGNMGYDFQEAFYRKVYTNALPALQGRIEFLFIVQEARPPFALSVLRISEPDVHVAERKVDAAREAWGKCRALNQWPGYPRGVQIVNLPQWSSREWLEREERGETEQRFDPEHPGGDWELARGGE